MNKVSENTLVKPSFDEFTKDTFDLSEELTIGEISSAEYIKMRASIVQPDNIIESIVIPIFKLLYEGLLMRIYPDKNSSLPQIIKD